MQTGIQNFKSQYDHEMIPSEASGAVNGYCMFRVLTYCMYYIM